MMESFSYENDEISPENDSAQWHCVRNLEYDMWISSPQSITERRVNFFRRFELSPYELKGHAFDGYNEGDSKRVMDNGEAVVRIPCLLEEKPFPDSSSISSWTASEDVDSSQEVEFRKRRKEEENFPQSLPEEDEGFNGNNSPQTVEKSKYKWFSKLSNMACMSSTMNARDMEMEMKRLKVNHTIKRSKEISNLFMGQSIRAHDGSISVMKFSLDGRYLATAGEDKLVKVWQIVEEERSDPSSAYFSANSSSELGHVMADRDRYKKFKILRKKPDSACIVLPPKVFRILEKPLNVFRGHSGEILDLSWSKNYCILSSSMDKTVRLWRVGVDRCLKVFSHTDYVTCIQFNPKDDDCFVSGSVDGKIRIWEISGRQVVKWTETKDIITAVSYRPDGNGGIIGFITGDCRFFNMSDGRIQLESEICLASKKKKKKPRCKRITKFQFLPWDPRKILVTCADLQVRMINGTEVVAKYKGLSTSDASVAITWPVFNTWKSASDVLESHVKDETINSTPLSSRREFYLDSNSKGSSATWPEEKLPLSSGAHHKLLFKGSSNDGLSDSDAWGLVVVAGDWQGRIKFFFSYGPPAVRCRSDN